MKAPFFRRRTSADTAEIQAPHAPIVPKQTTTLSPDYATILLSSAPVRRQHLRSPARVSILILLIFALVAGGSIGIWRVAMESVAMAAQANGNATATAQASLPGRVWHVQVSSTSNELRGVAWSGSQFVAVGENGTILTSP